MSLIPSGSLGAPACSLVPLLREVTINQGLGSYPKLVQGKETLVRAYLSKPSCATTTSAIRITGGTLTVRAGALTSTVQAPFPAQVTPYPLISPHYRTTPPVDSPGDPKWVVPGSFLDPTGTAGFTATFSIAVTYQSAANGTTFGATQTVSFTSSSKAVERETNPLRVLVVPVGDATVNFASQYSAAANEQVQLAMQTISRVFPVADGTGELNATTGGVRFTVLPTLIDIRAVLDTDGLYCLRGSSFDVPIKGQLQTLAQQWETENPGIQIDVAVAVIDPAISKGGSCAQGMAVAGSSYTSAAGLAVARMTPDQGGATLAMEIAHALGLVPAGRGRAGDPSHSPVTAADAGTNRGYNVRDRSFLADDRTALYNSGTGFTNTSTLMEQLDYQFLLCALGGATTSDCANPGLIGNNLPSGPRFVMSGTVAPDGLSVGNIVVAYSSNVPGTPPANSGPFTLSQINVPASGPTQVLRTDFVRVSFGGTHHEDGPHNAGVVDVAVPFNADADRIEFRNGSTVLQSFVASEVPELVSFQVVPAGESNYTSSSVDDASPTVSPDGQWVAWTTVPDEGFSRIHVGPIGNSDDAVEYSEISSELDGQSQYDPAWRFNGAALAFISDGDLYTIGVDPATGTPVTDTLALVSAYDEIDGAGLFASHPTWSPDGTQLAFDADGAIFVINATDGATGTETQLTFTGDASYPSWSQTDGDNRIAYERQAPSDAALGPTSTLASAVDPERPVPPAVADITDTNGDALMIAAPPSVQPGALESDAVVNAFDEGQVHLREPLSLDATANGTYDDLADLVGGTIPTDTIIKSHLVHFDPVAGATLSGAVFFDRPIIGVIASPEALDNSDYRVGTIRTTAYVAGMGDRGPELDGLDDDQFTISGNTLDFILTEQSGIDEIRVITDCGVVCVEVGPGPPQVVNTTDGDPTDDDGVCDASHCTLAEAINFANSNGDHTVITFDIPGSPPHTISPTQNLATLAFGTTIDGDSNIQLSGGAGANTGLIVFGGSIIRDMVINQFSTGVLLSGGASRLEGNYIGTDPTGTLDLGNSTYGVLIQSPSAGNVVGGIASGERNVISGNGGDVPGENVVINGGVGNYVIGNLIGTDASGTVAFTGTARGVGSSFASGTIVGGSDPLAGNVIGGGTVGVETFQGSGTIVLGNSIGAAIDSTQLGIVNSSVLVNDSPGARVGGSMTGASNVIANADFAGVQIAQDGSSGALVAYNAIVGNMTGVRVDGASDVTVGDPDGFFGNDISSNILDGVAVIGADGVRINANTIHDNGQLGIDLDDDDVTDNDPGDVDTGANEGQNTPVLTSTVAAGDTITVSGTLDTQADTLYRLDIYANATCDPSLSGEGEGWLGSLEDSTDGSGHLDWSFDGDASIAAGFGDVITATATDPLGNTSEFSVCDSAVAPNLVVNTTDGNALDDDGVCDATHCTLAEAIDDANATPGADTIGFAILGPGPHNIAVAGPLPAITEAVVIDGTTEPDYTSSPVVTIDGFGAAEANGLEIAADGVTIRGLAIADFVGAGIVVNGSNVVIESNIIGGSEEGNGGPGVRLEVGGAIAVGGTAEGAGHEISWNGGDGVEVLVGADFNPIRGNSIHDNGGLGIDLGPIDGVTANDEFDNDDGGNDEMNFPRILSATFDGLDTLISGDLDSETALASPTIDLYEVSNCDVSGNGEGETYLGSFTIPVGLDSNGHGEWSITLPGDMDGAELTATASDVTPQTSEFSECFTVETDPETFTVNTTDDHDLPDGCTVSDCALREAINRANATPGVDTITFDIAGTAPHVIAVSSESPLPVITDPVVIDGTSEPDYPLGGPPVIELDGSVTADGVNGLVLQAGDSTIRGLSIVGFPADGIHIFGSDNTIVANQIGANAGSGIVVEGASGTLIEGNGIGTNANGTLDIGNGGDGITVIDDITNGIIGGTSPDSPNRIKFNDGDGIGIDDSSSGIEIRVNLMDENGGLGIDLSQDNEVRSNDLGDGDPPDTDTGANGLQNYPYLDVSGDGALISGTLISTPDTDFEVDIFVSPVCDESGNGEGASFAGSVSVSTNQFGYGVFELAPDGPVGPTEVATATATGPEGTSEFSFCESAALNSDEIWTLDPSDPTNTQEQLVEDAVEPSWGTAGAIAFARDGDIYTIGSDGSSETQLTDLGLDSMPSLGGVPAFVRFVDDDSGTQDDVFLLLDEFNVLVTAADDHPELVRLDLIYSCPGSPNYDVAVGLVPTAVTATSANWAANFDASLACPNGTLRPVLTDFWNRTAPTGFDRQITSQPQPPVAAIYVPEVGDTLLQWNALALHGSGKDADDGELLGSSLQWFINGTEIAKYSASCGVTRSHCDIQPPGGAWPLPTGQNSTPLTVRLDVTDSDGDTHSDEVTIQVLRDADEDGIPATVEATCGLSDGDPRDSFTDGDNDLYLAQDDYALGGSPCVAATSYPAIVKFSPSTLFVPSSGSAVSMSVQLPLRDIRTVVPSTVKLQLISGAVVAIPNAGWSVDNKGVGTAKFDRQVVIQKLQQFGLTNSMVRYTIVGTSSQGWSFEGTDTQQAKPAS